MALFLPYKDCWGINWELLYQVTFSTISWGGAEGCKRGGKGGGEEKISSSTEKVKSK